jgi:hypothetical protein
MTRVRVPADVLRAIERLCSQVEAGLKHGKDWNGVEFQEHDLDCELIRRWLREKWGDDE